MGFLKSTSFNDRELTTRDSWWYRVWKPLSDELIRRLGDQNWITFTIATSLIADHGSGYVGHGYRVRDGVVYFYGTLDSTNPAGAPYLLYTLPAAYWPKYDMTFLTPAAGGCGRVDISSTDGTVYLVGFLGGATQTLIDLSSIVYPLG